MFVIGKREFIGLFKGIKSLVILAILLVTAYFSAKFSSLFTSSIELSASEEKNVYMLGVIMLLFLFGQVFVMSLSHDSINRETHERTIRFLVTRTSRSSIVFGKFLGIWLFWFVCLTSAFLLTSIFAKKLDFFMFSQAMSLVTVEIAFAILLSVWISKPALTMFLGITLGFILPYVGFWVVLTSNQWANLFKYVTPFYYLQRDDFMFLVNFALAGLMLLLATIMFKRREC